MTNVDTEEFMERGYVFLRQLIPPAMLEPLRQSSEAVIKRKWPDGMPEDAFQPWVWPVTNYIDGSTANLIEELVLHENVLAVLRQLLGAEAAPFGMMLMCNPLRDYGPWFWHRDINPATRGPLEGVQLDVRANGPGYLHCNIALYDDDVLWVVPGSHVRPNTDEENRQLSAVPHSYAHNQLPQGEKRHQPLPNSVCVDLRAGDAVFSHIELLHWASNYGPKLRRTFHLGYRAFKGPSFWCDGWFRDHEFTAHLSAQSRDFFARMAHLYDTECDTVEAAFRAIINEEEVGLGEGLAKLHPGETGRFMCLIHLCKYAQQMKAGTNNEFCPRFTTDEIDTLWERFTPLDEALKADEEQIVPAFQGKSQTRYRLNEMPEHFGIDEFVDAWKGAQN